MAGSIVQRDAVAMSVTDEVAGPPFGVLPGSPLWSLQEPNDISKVGAQIKTTPRQPISPNLQRRKGKVTDLDSGLEWSCDLTMEALARWLPGAMFAKYNGPGLLTDGDVYRPTAVTATGYTVAASGALAADTLIYASGFNTTANNGFKVVTASIATEIRAAGLVAEAAIPDSQNATVAVCGRQGAAGDLQINAGGNLISAALDFTTLGLTEGQVIWIGGDAAATRFATAADRGFARIAKSGLAANLLTLNKKATVFTVDNGAAKTIQLFFGRFSRNVNRGDVDYLFRSHQIEVTWPDLGGVGTDKYSYALGNVVDQFNVELPITNKGGISMVLVGTDTATPTTARATNASAARRAIQTDSFNTSSEIMRLRSTLYDETGLTTDFLSATLQLKNNVSGKKVLAQLGAKYINRGWAEVDVDCEVLFTDSAVLDAVRNNTTVTMDMALRNADSAGVFIDLPSVTIGDGAPDLPEHDLVAVKTTFAAFQDALFGYTISWSLFPYLPLPT